ncbi:TetR/AcrR family transcriptional regulator [Caldimonas brevitalea]|uniref:Transcriptional regulator, TetR family n=1 Tax=Caldimonas brevitalea TaxID=413882 RepID=A0A0G3BWX2_9BURK|nr:TetR/AcrR family transcriptional regulator [Caldimonas brevitalea]AKJ31861.1 transcriptional regulator, TetR family [Caldimonas brevitalea]
MPHSPTHKSRSRQRILASARELFSNYGFEATSIDAVMAHCGLTRGAFYAHFASKGALYREALGDGAVDAGPVGDVSEELDRWFHACQPRPDSLDTPSSAARFLVADIASGHPDVRAGYGPAFEALVQRLAEAAGDPTEDRAAALAAAAMALGAFAVASTVDDADLKSQLAATCRAQAERLLRRDDVGDERPTFFWSPDAPARPHARRMQ